MTTLILIRHGLSVTNKAKRFTGQMDVPLDEIGLVQARDVSEYVLKNYKVDAVYSSDLSRAVNTVKPIADALSLDVITDKRFRELDVGEWQGKTFDEVEEQYPDELRLYRANVGRGRPTGGECHADLKKRTMEALDEIVLNNPDKTVVIGTHGGAIRNIRASIKGYTLDEIVTIPPAPNASLTVAIFNEGKYELILEAFNGYLTNTTTEAGLKK